jgi:hypothetical protein
MAQKQRIKPTVVLMELFPSDLKKLRMRKKEQTPLKLSADVLMYRIMTVK